ncbi:putative nuclear pore protein 84/107 [Medicago truncatula]|uniref:Nuclear pore complex protein n=1 Tax=Medicago truncatula TaxID=3880 RepID=G7L8A5_MEDTR|nr:nuclear pore complex protein NUP107 [Medicago truncatula]AET01826.2 nuclear pore protein [Medicago truncatula]RHN39505.1 putative nuclear pore protein 84/107 [Medicago truncatula]
MEEEMAMDSPFFDPQDLTTREKFRRYGKRHLNSGASVEQDYSASKLSESGLFYDGQNIHSPTNAALILENIKQEVESLDADYLDDKSLYSSRKRSSADVPGIPGMDDGFDSVRYSLKACKQEGDSLGDDADNIFNSFASLFDTSLTGMMPIPDLILRFENECRNVSESIRYGLNIRHRVVEDKLMRQKAQLLLDEAATWSLLWFLYGEETEELSKEKILVKQTSHLMACEFVTEDHIAQLCLRIVQWLEGLASKALDLEAKVRGSHVGSYLPSSGVWHHTQRYLNKGTSDRNVVHHLDFDAPTRENANILPDDKKQDESLLEDVWTLLRAGRLEEACGLCRSAGQPWRASSLCPFGGLNLFPSVEALAKNGKNRTLQAVEFESGIGHQWHLWKWASYCASEKISELGGKYEAAVYAAQCSNLRQMLPLCTDWESACWAMAKSWLDVQIDLEVTRSLPGGGVNQLGTFGDVMDRSPGQVDGSFDPSNGPENWPIQVLNQQPRQLSSLLQKLHSGEMIHETVTRQCKEQQRQIQMTLMLADIPRVLDLIWSWIAPVEDDQNVFRPHGDPQMIRFGAHLVLVLRYLPEAREEMKGALMDKILTVGDHILHLYAKFLFSKEHEELVGIYASQLARHRCIDLFVYMMEFRLHSSVHVKYKIFLSAMEYLPFSLMDESKGCFEDIIERVLLRSREIKIGKYDNLSDVAEQHRQQSLEKAKVIQWLCFTPPSTIANVKDVSKKLLLRALIHSNVLFREFALISMWRVPAMPIGAHTALGFLAEPLKQLAETLEISDDHNVFEDLREFEEWREYYSCDATYRNWLKIESENAEVPVSELSLEEKERAISAAKETLTASLSLLERRETHWLASIDNIYESAESVFLELHATAMLCLPSGDCLCPDATVCTTLTSALYSSAGDEVVSNRQLVVNATISSRDHYCIDVVLRCLAIVGDGLRPHDFNDGGILSTIIAAGFKGELPRFQAGVAMEISRLDAWYSDQDGNLEFPATYIVKGLCRRCCLPEVVLRCMQVSVSLMGSGDQPDSHDNLIELVGSPETRFLDLFSQQQLQEFLLMEREYSICKLEHTQE